MSRDKATSSRKAVRPRGGRPVNYVPAAEFKATCLELLGRVRETGADYVVTRHGRPVARVVPYESPARAGTFFGSLKGSVLAFDRPFDSIDGEYDIHAPEGAHRSSRR